MTMHSLLFRFGRAQSISKASVRSKKKFVTALQPVRQSFVTFEIPSGLFPDRAEIKNDAARAYSEKGVWPVSFSLPSTRGMLDYRGDKDFVNTVVPGEPYQFDREQEYYAQYQKFWLALTHKKGGWDCFRHLEIVASGALPLMPDVCKIPRNTMVHYPKKPIGWLAENFGWLTDSSRLELMGAFQNHVERFQTCRRMAEYVLEASKLSDAARVLFLDESLARTPDYLSIFTLIGLKNILGSAVDVAFPADYLYRDWGGKKSGLYGRGFGYTSSLDPAVKSDMELGASLSSFQRSAMARDIDAVVVGNITRNEKIAREMLGYFPPERTIWIHGEDRGPSDSELETLRSTGVNLFVRELV